MSRSYEVFSDALSRLRTTHAAEAYEFDTSQTYCPASDGPTDQCDVCAILPALPRPFRSDVRHVGTGVWHRATPEAQEALAREIAELEVVEARCDVESERDDLALLLNEAVEREKALEHELAALRSGELRRG